MLHYIYKEGGDKMDVKSAREAYEAVEKPAREAYDAVEKPAWEAREAAVKSAEEAYYAKE